MGNQYKDLTAIEEVTILDFHQNALFEYGLSIRAISG